ncbi:MAG: alpha/beta fold hydrolase [Saprospiraceae bacterium]|nr:alpha/beta fold hydrolase [Saprospiraceae bacterium]
MKTFTNLLIAILFATILTAQSKLENGDGKTNCFPELTLGLRTSHLPCTEKGILDTHFPYPVIFIHGLRGSADTWTAFYNHVLNQGWSYGGHLMFNLNYDEDFGSSTLNDIKDFNASNIEAADFYLMNFNVTVNGVSQGASTNTDASLSNQSAIVKQGNALGKAIEKVLQATGSDKVILYGHSMGGLCAREYLQNPNNWPDGKHHVAKLVTSGTPHGGSNSTGTILAQIFTGIDESSEAVRDLRRSYFYSGEQGVYLFGGTENSTIIWDNLAGFYSLDVNCNGNTGNSITGLNQKQISTDLDFACIVSEWSFNPDFGCGDGIVGCEEANLKNYYDVLSESFNLNVSHTNMNDNVQRSVEALDEPDYYHLSYYLTPNEWSNAFITQQGSDAEYSIDYDDFVFQIYQTGKVKVELDNVSATPFGISILNDDYEYLFDETYNSQTFTTNSTHLEPGIYYLEFYANPDNGNWQTPYNFKLHFTSDSPSTTEDEQAENSTVFPNPTSNKFTIGIQSFSGTATVYNGSGQTVQIRPFEANIISQWFDLSEYPTGVYYVKLQGDNTAKTLKVIKI